MTSLFRLDLPGSEPLCSLKRGARAKLAKTRTRISADRAGPSRGSPTHRAVRWKISPAGADFPQPAGAGRAGNRRQGSQQAGGQGSASRPPLLGRVGPRPARGRAVSEFAGSGGLPGLLAAAVRASDRRRDRGLEHVAALARVQRRVLWGLCGRAPVARHGELGVRRLGRCGSLMSQHRLRDPPRSLVWAAPQHGGAGFASFEHCHKKKTLEMAIGFAADPSEPPN
jgi:hypothetical protein